MNNIIDTLSMLPYIIPGSVVGIALVMGFSKGPLVLTGTAAIMVVSMCIRRIPYTTVSYTNLDVYKRQLYHISIILSTK